MLAHILGTDSMGKINPGTLWYDTDGKLIQAHGGGMCVREENGQTVYYWYGEDNLKEEITHEHSEEHNFMLK